MAPTPIADHPVAHLRVVSADYFRTLEIPLRGGRDFDTRDDAAPRGHPRFVIVNQALAARYWPGQSAVGKRLREDFNPESVTIAGVVGDVRYASLDAPPDLEIYLPDGVFPESAMTLLVKTSGEPQALISAVRQRIRSVDSEAFVSDVQSMDELVSASLAGRSFATLLLTLCAGIALLLALSGIYGVVTQAAAQRRMEIGIRLALGATEGSVVRWMLRLAMQPVAIGVIAGGLASLALTRLLTALLYGIAPFDPATVAATVTLFAVVGATAAFLPARRAAKTDPLTVLHAE
jgi:predicted permease